MLVVYFVCFILRKFVFYYVIIDSGLGEIVLYNSRATVEEALAPLDTCYSCINYVH